MFIWNFIEACWKLFAEMSPFLLIGFFTAGILHAFIPSNKIYRHLSAGDVKSVVKAALVGVPLPLCSCGVIPVAEYLRSRGAGVGAVLSFLLSTPTTGVDSLLATYSLLGLPVTIMRMLAAVFSGILSGVLSNLFINDFVSIGMNGGCCSCCASQVNGSEHIEFSERLKAGLKYGLFRLVADTRKWIIIGIIAGGLIEILVPKSFIEFFVRHGMVYPAVLFMAIPMYVCATGSIPVAAALVAKGFPLGAAVIFLVSGPATNTVTISFVKSKLGTKALIIYLSSIVLVSLFFALLTDMLFSGYSWSIGYTKGGFFSGVKVFSSLMLAVLFVMAKGKD